MTISEKIEITAGTIRSRAREIGISINNISEIEAARLAEAQVYDSPNTIAAEFYLEATDRQWKRIYNQVKRGSNGKQN
jgi:hypothetical protein